MLKTHSTRTTTTVNGTEYSPLTRGRCGSVKDQAAIKATTSTLSVTIPEKQSLQVILWNVRKRITEKKNTYRWAFLNHISLLYYYGLINALRNNKLDDKYSAEDVLKLTKNIYRVDTGDGQGIRVSAVQKKTQELLNALNVNLLRDF